MLIKRCEKCLDWLLLPTFYLFYLFWSLRRDQSSRGKLKALRRSTSEDWYSLLTSDKALLCKILASMRGTITHANGHPGCVWINPRPQQVGVISKMNNTRIVFFPAMSTLLPFLMTCHADKHSCSYQTHTLHIREHLSEATFSLEQQYHCYSCGRWYRRAFHHF